MTYDDDLLLWSVMVGVRNSYLRHAERYYSIRNIYFQMSILVSTIILKTCYYHRFGSQARSKAYIYSKYDIIYIYIYILFIQTLKLYLVDLKYSCR